MNRRRLSGAGFAAAGCLSLARFVLDPGLSLRPGFDLVLGVGLLALAAYQLLLVDDGNEEGASAGRRQRLLVVLLLSVAAVAVGVGLYAAASG